MSEEINKFYPSWVHFRPDGSLNPNWIDPCMNCGQYIEPPTNVDATQYVVPQSNNTTATEFAPERQNSNEYIVPTYSNEIRLAPERGLPFVLLLDDVKAYEDFKKNVVLKKN
jgi:hypothetical protein